MGRRARVRRGDRQRCLHRCGSLRLRRATLAFFFLPALLRLLLADGDNLPVLVRIGGQGVVRRLPGGWRQTNGVACCVARSA